MEKERYKEYNVYADVEGTTETVLIDSDTVVSDHYGSSSIRLHVTSVIIANASSSNPAVIDLYLKHEEDGGPRVIIDEYGNQQVQPTITVTGTKDTYTTISRDVADPDAPKETTTYYLLRGTTIPLGTTLILEKEMFKDIDFKYYNLCAVGDSNTIVDLIINFK